MKKEFCVTILDKDEYLKNSCEIGLDEEWKKKSPMFDERLNEKGVYIIHMPARIVYIGKTRGPTMDFRTRLYRHATKAASSNSTVYQTLKVAKEKGEQIFVALLPIDRIRRLYRGKDLTNEMIVDTYEQVLIHALKPEIQDENR